MPSQHAQGTHRRPGKPSAGVGRIPWNTAERASHLTLDVPVASLTLPVAGLNLPVAGLTLPVAGVDPAGCGVDPAGCGAAHPGARLHLTMGTRVAAGVTRLRSDFGGFVGPDSVAPAVHSPAPVSRRFDVLIGREYHLSPHGSPVVGPAVQCRQSLQEGAAPQIPNVFDAEPVSET